jgi:Gpi18-like mannosyltransferase
MRRWELSAVILSVAIQLLLGFFLGHYYDVRIFMASGYAVSSGLNPYIPNDFSAVFHHTLFAGDIPGIGYPPPWPLVLGVVYRLSFNVFQNLFVYNLAIKIPVIVGNVVLAYAVKRVLTKLDVSKQKIQSAWLFVLFNPFLIITTSAWGQFDAVVALFYLTSLYFLYAGRNVESAALLALSVSLKPITLPLIALPAMFLSKNKSHKRLAYYTVFIITLLLTVAFPFVLFGWSTQNITNNLDAHFEVAGAMSPFNILEIFTGSPLLTEPLAILGFLWAPALIISYYLLTRSPPHNLEELIKSALFLTFVFFLTRTWLSEQNINLVLPLILIVVAKSNNLKSRILHLTWIIPFAFMFFNTSFHQLFFLVYPDVLTSIAAFDQYHGVLRLTLRFLMVIPWQFLGWKVVSQMKIKRLHSGTEE